MITPAYECIRLLIVTLTQFIDIFTVATIGISFSQFATSLLLSILRRHIIIKNKLTNRKERYKNRYLTEKGDITNSTKENYKSIIQIDNNNRKNFINGLLFALELESANAILKMGLFTSSISSTTPLSNNFNNFLFFVIVLSIRILINQSLKRFHISNKNF